MLSAIATVLESRDWGHFVANTLYYRPLYGCEGMLGKEDMVAGNSKVCMGIQSQLILPNWIYSLLSLCILQLMNFKKLYVKCGVHSSPLSLFRKFDVFHTLSLIFVLSDYRKCMEELRFSKKQQRTAICTPDLACIQLARINKLLIIPPSFPDYPACPHNRKGVY